MRIVINALSARLGGSQTHLLHLLQNLPPWDDLEIVIFADDSFRVPVAGAIEVRETGWPTRNVAVRTLWERTRLPSLLREMKADILFCPGGLINTTPPSRCRSVTMFRNMLPFDLEEQAKYSSRYLRLRMRLQRHAMLRSMRAANLVIFISEYARRRIEELPGRPVKRAVTIPHGLTNHFRSMEGEVERPEWLPREEYLLYVSSLYPYKNQVEVVRGFALMKERRGGDEKLVLAGQEEEAYGRAIRAEIRRWGLENDVVLAGLIPYSELPRVYRHAKVNIFASTCENCPNIVLEALGAGRPLLVSDRPPMPEFAGDAAIYFDPASPDDLAEKLATLIDGLALRERLGERALAQSHRFDWTHTAERTWQALRDLLEE
jgi:glycosyltransferase involved in cell wall biosynthesis